MKDLFLLMVLGFVFSSGPALGGPCKCPDDTKKNGDRCGEGSALCRSGGDEPMCGAKNAEELQELLRVKCPKSFKKYNRKSSR